MAQVPLGENDRRIQYTAAGGEPTFDYDFPLFGNTANLELWRTRSGLTALLVEGVDYSVAGEKSATGGTITLTPAAVAGDVYTAMGDMLIAVDQLFTNRKPLNVPQLNDFINEFTATLQEIRRDLDRTPVLPPETATGVNATLPDPTAPENQGKLIGISAGTYPAVEPGDPGAVLFGAYGEAWAATGDLNAALNLLAVSAYIRTLFDDADSAAARATLEIMWSTLTGKPGIMPQAEAEAGQSQTERTITAERLAQAVAALPGKLATIYHLQHTQPNGTAGGAGVNGAWTVVPLNSEVEKTVAGASIDGNFLMTLPAGTYELQGSQCFERGGSAQLRLQNVTDGVTLARGAQVYANSTTDGNIYAGDGIMARVEGRVILAAEKTVELQYYKQTAVGATTLGRAMTLGLDEIYGELLLRKIA